MFWELRGKIPYSQGIKYRRGKGYTGFWVSGVVASIRGVVGHINWKNNIGAPLVELSPERACLEDAWHSPTTLGIKEPVPCVRLLGISFQKRHLVAARSNSSSRIALGCPHSPYCSFSWVIQFKMLERGRECLSSYREWEEMWPVQTSSFQL